MTTAHSEHYRRAGWMERIGAALRRPLGQRPAPAALRSVYHRLLLLSTFGRGLEASLPGGEAIRILPQYRYVTWNPDEYSAFKEVLGPGDVAFDIGANVGCYAMLFSQLVSPGGRVFAFEPSPRAFHGLTRHIALNRLEGVVVSIQSALADREGVSDFILSGSTGTDHLGSLEASRVQGAAPAAAAECVGRGPQRGSRAGVPDTRQRECEPPPLGASLASYGAQPAEACAASEGGWGPTSSEQGAGCGMQGTGAETERPAPRTQDPGPGTRDPGPSTQDPGPRTRRSSVTHVDVVTLDGFCEREGLRPDFVKIDVEGAELAVLRGARRTIEAMRNHLSLFVEMHPSIWPTLGVKKADLVAELERQSLRVEPLVKGQDPWAVEGVCVRLVPY